MTLYEINQNIMSLIDEETGEITDIVAFEALLEHEDERLSMNSIHKMELAMEDGKKGDFDIWNCK